MFRFCLLALFVGLACAALNTCEDTRAKTIQNFLFASNGRSFSRKIALHAKDWGFEGKLRHVRWLPVFNDGDGKFTQFFLLEGNFTAVEAFNACQRLDGAYLAALNSAKRLEFINKALVAGNYWIGLQRWANCPYFLWSNGEQLGKENLYWKADEPRVTSTGFDCVRTVTPTDMACNATFCSAKSYASWATEACEGTNLFSALCETNYPLALFGLIPGKFDFKSANAACKSTFAMATNAGLALPKTKAAFDDILFSAHVHFRKFNCWLGLERLYENAVWKHRWLDSTWATRFSYLPRLYGYNYTSWTDSQTCVSIWDGDFAVSKGFENRGYIDYNNCDAKLDCAICEWFWPL